MSTLNACRLCRKNLSSEPSLQINNLPLGVQFFPRKDEFNKDIPVKLEIHYCKFCGLVQTVGNQVVYDGENSAATSVSPKMLRHKSGQARDFIKKYNLIGKNILEAGCGDGHFLKMLQQAGAATAIGVEPSLRSKQSSQFKDEVTIYSGYISSNNILSEGPFDGFASFHVLEHIPDIHDFIAGLSNNLKIGAIGFIEVPSSELILEEARFYDIINDHLNYFTLSTLKLAFQMNNFEVLEAYRDWNDEHNCLVVRKMGGPDFHKILEMKENTIINLLSILNNFGDQRVAIWGASMHSMTLLSQIRTSKIKYVVDSASYKQGRYMPINRYPIVDPSELRFNEVDCVIVIAPRFVDEIVEDLLSGIHEFNGTVGVLENDSVLIKK